mmetsp:Transcript_22585/g.54567  ORF Transcript_22585/g.54567 Transcript_22585/m.54567 type:complete len:159 (-) Transcript_22585:274-750(-)
MVAVFMPWNGILRIITLNHGSSVLIFHRIYKIPLIQQGWKMHPKESCLIHIHGVCLMHTLPLATLRAARRIISRTCALFSTWHSAEMLRATDSLGNALILQKKFNVTNDHGNHDPVLTCNAYIESNPEALEEAFWKIKGVYVYERELEKPKKEKQEKS